MRRKGERPIVTPKPAWSEVHPVYQSIRRGTGWLDAWLGQYTTPLHVIEKRTGIAKDRLFEIIDGGDPTEEEVTRLARLWSVTPADIRASRALQALVRAAS